MNILLPCFHEPTIGTADNGVARHAAEFRAVASVNVIIAAGIRG
jgi:hypothetical protein